jgi:nucleoid-associated protein YgaU
LYESKTKREPPYLAFEWGVFYFRAVITNMSQKFTLFKVDGTPVRAQVEVAFTQYADSKDYKHQNPTSGGGPVQRVWSVVRGDRLDTIAATVYGDATQWRRIADHNGLRDPLALTPGQQLIIPEER